MLWLDIEDSSGAKVSDGPLTCLLWEYTPRLSRAGTWRAEVPAGERRLSYAAHKLRVRCRMATPEGVIEVGAGIIDAKQTRVVAGSSTVTLTGDDLLGETGYRLVFGELSTIATYVPTLWFLVDDTWFGPWAGNVASPEMMVEETDSYIYIGLAENTFNRVDFVMSYTNVVPTQMKVGVSDERGGDLYREPDELEDTTIVDGVPLAQNGFLRYPRPASWYTREVGDGGSEIEAYWMRLDPQKTIGRDDPDTPTAGIKFSSVSVKSYTPRTDDISYLISTFAPSGWSLSGLYYNSTANGTLRRFDGESLLAVLVAISEQTGEQFRLGTGRQIEWLRTLQPDSGVTLVQAAGDMLAMRSNADIGIITDLQIMQDAAGMFTRIYPYGAGNADSRTTLAESDMTMPTGYTMDAANNYIKRDASEAAYGRIERRVEFKDIGAADGSGVRDRAASNELARAALTMLQQHSAPYTSYNLTVTGLQKAVKPGDLVRVQYREYRDGYAALNINEQMVVLEPTTQVDADGVRTVAMVVAPAAMPRYPVTDAEIQARALEQLRRMMALPQAVAGRLVR